MWKSSSYSCSRSSHKQDDRVADYGRLVSIVAKTINRVDTVPQNIYQKHDDGMILHRQFFRSAREKLLSRPRTLCSFLVHRSFGDDGCKMMHRDDEKMFRGNFRGKIGSLHGGDHQAAWQAPHYLPLPATDGQRCALDPRIRSMRLAGVDVSPGLIR